MKFDSVAKLRLFLSLHLIFLTLNTRQLENMPTFTKLSTLGCLWYMPILFNFSQCKLFTTIYHWPFTDLCGFGTYHKNQTLKWELENEMIYSVKKSCELKRITLIFFIFYFSHDRKKSKTNSYKFQCRTFLVRVQDSERFSLQKVFNFFEFTFSSLLLCPSCLSQFYI